MHFIQNECNDNKHKKTFESLYEKKIQLINLIVYIYIYNYITICFYTKTQTYLPLKIRIYICIILLFFSI